MMYLGQLEFRGEEFVLTFPDLPGLRVIVHDLGEIRQRAALALDRHLTSALSTGVTPAPPAAAPVTGGHASLRVPVDPRLAVQLQLRWARRACGLSRADVARRMGVSRQRVTRLESPDVNLTLDTIDRLCRAIGCRLDIVLHPLDDAALRDGTHA